ncbi:MAG: hypothetical protein ABI921_00635 [Panacibacter sp.]
MKKVFLVFLLSSAAFVAMSQNYNSVMLTFTTQKFEDAKKEADKLIADPKMNTKAETFLWKFRVYSELFADSTLRNKYPDAGTEAVDALNQYVAKEADLKLLKEEGLRGVSILYGQSFNYGRSAFQKSDWASAYTSFNLCQQVSEFIGKHGLSTSGKYTIDTTVVLYTGYAAQNAGKTAEAAARYKSLADWKVGDKDFEEIYKFILDYDTRQKDDASFKKYLAVAKELYPQDMPLWNQIDMTYMGMNSSLTDIITKYKADDAAGKLKEDDYLTYAESFASPDKSQLSQLDSIQQVNLKNTAAEAFSKAFNLNNNGLYAFNAGVLYYNIFGLLDDKYYALRGESADLKTQRDAVVKEQQEMASKSIEWLEKGYTILKAKATREKGESNSLNRSVDYLANLYVWKRDKSRGNGNTKDYDAFDAKYKIFDNEHDKYKQ